ncbi:MAG: DUF3306 domain-containing protein [Betaproteobacteria bacterium]
MGDTDDGFLSRWSRRKVQARDGQAQTETPGASPTAPAALHAAQGPAASGAASASAAPDAARLTPDPPSAQAQGAPPSPAAAPPPAPPPPTMEDVARLTHDSDYSRFVGRGVDPGVKNAALHKLFADPHFNVMDGLDTYIDDYGRPDPLPAGMLEKMVQSEALGLFTKTPEPADNPAVPAAGPQAPADAAPFPDTAFDAPSDTAPHPASDTSADTPADPPRPPPEARAHEDPDLRLQPHDAAGTAEPPGPCGHGAAGPEQDPGRQR